MNLTSTLSNVLSLEVEPYSAAIGMAFATAAAQEICPAVIDLTTELLSKGKDSQIYKVFQSFHNQIGITCKNYLPWNDSFHAGGTGYIDGIKPSDITDRFMWGVDWVKRPFIAVKQLCTDGTQGAFTIFQRYTDHGWVVTGGHHAYSPDYREKCQNPEGCQPKCVPYLSVAGADNTLEEINDVFNPSAKGKVIPKVPTDTIWEYLFG